MRRFTHVLLVGVALVLAVGTATAAASTRPDDRAVHGIGAIDLAVSDSVLRPDDRAWRGIGPAPTSATGTPVRPDDRANHGPGAVVEFVPVRPDDRAWRGVGPEPSIVPNGSPTSYVDGFDWVDAGIGAVGAFGLALLLAGASAFVMRRHRVAALT